MTVDGGGDRSVRFEKSSGGGGSRPGKRLPGRTRGAFQSQPNLNRMMGGGSRGSMTLRVTPSMYRLDHLNPQQRASLGKSYMHLAKSRTSLKKKKKAPVPGRSPKDAVVIGMEKPDRPYRNKHIASAHRLIADSSDDEPSFKQRLAALMNTYNWQIAMVVLIILDCVMVLGEMVIELRLFQGEECEEASGKHGHGHSGDHSAPAVTTLASVILNATVEAVSGHGESKSEPHVHSDCEHLQHTMHEVEHAFHWTSICILFLFNVELVLRLFAQGYKYFLHLEIALDAIIVMVSFGLDIAFLDSKMKKYLYLLIILRVWRVLRVVHAIITAIRAPHERQIEKLKKKKKMLQRDLAKAYFYSNMLEEEIRNLRNIIDSFEIVEEYDEEDYDYEEQATIDRNNNDQYQVKGSSKKSLTFQEQQEQSAESSEDKKEQ